MIKSAADIGATDAGALGALQVRVLLLCIGCMVLDGFDLQAMSYAAPALIQDWHVPKETLGPVFGAALFGILVGSLLFSVVADKVGRRPVVVWAVTGVAIATLLTARASSLTQLLVLRFVAGIAMGGMLPNAIALAGEHCPPRMRISLMMVVGCGFTAGAAAGGLISSWLIPHLGWRAVFYVGGALPLVIAAAMWRGLPESPSFRSAANERHTERVTIISLFRQGRTSATLRLWAVDFLILINLYFLSSWLPTIARASGRATSDAVLVGAVLQIGGTIGTLALSWLCSRFGFASVLGACFLAAASSIALLGQAGLSLHLIFGLVFIAGFCVVGSQPAVIALAASYYPTRLRSTGIGWVLGVGRVGAIAGPVVAGELLRLDWSAAQLFRAAAIPAVASAALMYSLRPVTMRLTAQPR